MRFMFRQGKNEELQEDLNIVQDVLNSGYFIIIDLFFWAFLLAIFTTPALHSFRMFLLIYASYYITGVSLYLMIRRWFKTEKQFQRKKTEKSDQYYSFKKK